MELLAGKHLELSSSLFSLHFTILIILFSSLSLQPHNFLGLATSTTAGNDTDQQALLQLKAEITSDPLGVMQMWNNTIPFCHWYGVTCGEQHRDRVTKLELPSLELAGTISPYIGNLSFLKVLDLDNNSFSHEIPQEIGHLRRLEILYIPNNTLSGEIPSNLSSCLMLTLIHLRGNLLGGGIPGELGLLSNLKTLSLSLNQLAGSIPPSLGNLSSLEFLSLGGNNLSGAIPDVLGQLRNLTFFSLFYNHGISGTIPASVSNLSNIRLLDFGSNMIEGSLPSNLGLTMPYIEVFTVQSNRLTGPFPTSLSNASNLVELQLTGNKFRGNLPSFEMLDKLSRFTISANHFGPDLNFLCSLTNATGLEHLQIGANNFSGVLPECLSNLSTNLVNLNIQENQITGRIPADIGNLVNLEALEALDNQLSGSIPLSIGRLQKLTKLDVSINFLSGAIPSSFGNMSRINFLQLGRNNFQGQIPSSLGKCKNLAQMDLSYNHLNGSIPPEIFGLSSLSISLDLSSNFLTGELPSEVGNLRNLGELDVSQNRLSGVLPNNLGSCESMEVLLLQGNSFKGSIPSSLSSLRGLTSLDLSSNNLSGEIPEFIVSFRSLLYLNLSFNDFQGVVPIEGVFKNASVAFLQGNGKLCGGTLELHLPRCNLKTSMRNSTISLKLKIGIAFVILGVILVLIACILIFYLRKKKEQQRATIADNPLLSLSYHSLLKATDGFSSANLVGSGSFGSVYKGILEESGVAIAVKVLNLVSHGATRSFIAECEALRNVRHRNLVKVLTACSGIDYHGNNFKAIVYEFMVNGSLDDWLHPSVEAGEVAKQLNFNQRLNMVIDIGYALEYLHHHCETPIVHCDLKPSNILLDDQMVCHVGDFGLAKFIASDMQLQTNNSSMSSSLGLRGTIGYAPPEYGMGSVVTTYGDVYSYGILLLEMFTGKRPTNEMFRENMNLHNFVKTALPNRVAEITDPVILQESYDGEAMINKICNESQAKDNKPLQCLNSIFEIGVACSVDLPAERMNMTDVVAKLCSIRDKLLPTPSLRSRARG